MKDLPMIILKTLEKEKISTQEREISLENFLKITEVLLSANIDTMKPDLVLLDALTEQLLEQTKKSSTASL